MQSQIVRKGYDKIADQYAQMRQSFDSSTWLLELICRLWSESTILDVGCGAGTPVDEYLVNSRMRVIGLDHSEEQIKRAKVNVPKAAYLVQDMEDLAMGDFHVEAVVCFYTIFHVARHKHLDLLRTFASFLDRGGYLLITMGTENWEGYERFPDPNGAIMFWSHYDAETNRQLIRQAGFEIVLDAIDESANEKHLVILARKK